ncbi:MAG: caspase family protein, partial [Armatimonadota bacterium]|nr:caspase family protein [Armatimonadota bacterium]
SGLDETLVPSDWVQDGSKDIRDKELRALVQALQAKKPANLTMTFDSCHSGTITRGGRMLVRGVPFEKRFGRPAPSPTIPPGAATRGGRMLVRGAFGDLLNSGNRANAESNYVVISACRDDQSAVETEDENHNPMGRLSFLLCQTLRQAGPQTTYQDIFEQIDSLMRQKYTDQRQDPQIEGDRNQVLLGKGAVEAPSYLLVNADKDKNLHLEAGSLQGVTTGSVYALYAPGSKDFTPQNQIAEAKVASTRLLQSPLEITRTLKPNVSVADMTALRAIETTHQYGDKALRVSQADVNALPNGAALLAALQANPAIAIVTGPDALPDVRLKRAADAIFLTREDGGAQIAKIALGPDQSTQINDVLKREAQWRFVQALNNSAPNSPLKIELRVVPAKVSGNEQDGYTFLGDKPLSRGPLALQETELATIEVRNLGNVDAYVSVLDIQSDGSVHRLWPDPDATVGANLIPSGHPDHWQKLWLADPSQPFLTNFAGSEGAESFKAIATREKVDFKALTTTREAKSPLEQILLGALTGTRARAAASPTLWYTSTVAFNVTPEQKP